MRRLTAAELPPLAEFLHVDAETFYPQAELNYPLAWAVTHFFHHGSQRVRRLYRGLFDELASGASAAAALSRAFPAAEWAALEQEFRAHLKTMR